MRVVHCDKDTAVVVEDAGFTLSEQAEVICVCEKATENPGTPKEKQTVVKTVVNLVSPSAKMFKMMAAMMTMKEGKDTIIFVSEDGKFGMFVSSTGFIDMTAVRQITHIKEDKKGDIK